MAKITIGNKSFEFSMSPAQLAALGEKKVLSNEAREENNKNKTENLDSLFESGEEYLQWVMGIWYNSQTPLPTDQEVLDKIQSTLNSYANVIVPNQEPVLIESLSPEEAKAKLKAHASNKRWSIEVGGTTFLGMTVPTDDRAKVLLMGAAGSMSDEETAPFIVSGNAITLTGAQFKQIYNTVTVDRVRQLFEDEAIIISKINSGEITETSQIDNYIWTK